MISDLYPGGEQGWTTVETVLIQLDTGLSPSARFSVYANKQVKYLNRKEIRIGYDAAVCVQKYEPWIIEAYKASIVSPTLLGIVGRAYSSTSSSPSGKIRGTPMANGRYFNATGKGPAFEVANDFGRLQMAEFNTPRDSAMNRYAPSPTVGRAIPRV